MIVIGTLLQRQRQLQLHSHTGKAVRSQSLAIIRNASSVQQCVDGRHTESIL